MPSLDGGDVPSPPPAQPQDTVRVVTTAGHLVREEQVGNRRQGLQAHPDNTCCIGFGNKEFREKAE